MFAEIVDVLLPNLLSTVFPYVKFRGKTEPVCINCPRCVKPVTTNVEYVDVVAPTTDEQGAVQSDRKAWQATVVERVKTL